MKVNFNLLDIFYSGILYILKLVLILVNSVIVVIKGFS